MEMTRESFRNYLKALKMAMYNYSQGKDTEKNGKKILFILHEFGIDIELSRISILSENPSYNEVDDLVADLFFGSFGLVDKVDLVDY